MRQAGFQAAEGFAQFGEQIFGAVCACAADKEEAALCVAHGLGQAAADECFGQKFVRNLLFHFLFFFAPDAAGFGVLDFGDAFIQNFAHHDGGQHFFGFFQGDAPCVAGGEDGLGRKAVRGGKAFAGAFKSGYRGKRGFAELGGKRWGVGQFFCGNGIEAELFEPHGASFCFLDESARL